MRCALALLLLPLLVACGSIRYRPLEMLHPAELADSTVRVGSLQLRLRASDEWIELSLRNHGPDLVVVDWGDAVFVEPDGRVHRLLPASRVGALESALRRGDPGDWSSGGPVAADVEPLPLSAYGAARLLAAPPEDARVPLPPGGDALEVLYPTEHLRVGIDGRLRAASLFCRPAARGRSGEFEVHLPVQRPSGREVVTLVARPAGW